MRSTIAFSSLESAELRPTSAKNSIMRQQSADRYPIGVGMELRIDRSAEKIDRSPEITVLLLWSERPLDLDWDGKRERCRRNRMCLIAYKTRNLEPGLEPTGTRTRMCGMYGYSETTLPLLFF
jgi:hypothetical protein